MFKLRIQMVVYKNSITQLRAAIDSIIHSAKLYTRDFQIVLGSNSHDQSMNDGYIKLVKEYSAKIPIKLYVSRVNIGHGAMHNHLFFKEFDESELLLVVNPDGLIGPMSLSAMAKIISSKEVGAVEPRQLPFEHPKLFNLSSGETTWASGACLLLKAALFQEIRGFDERFFLHCDDIDLSWRIRDKGFKLIYSPESIFFHDKTVAENGHPQMSESESFYGPLGALLLAHKYELRKGLNYMLKDIAGTSDPIHTEILRVFKLQSKIHPTLRIQKGIPNYVHPWKFSETRY